MSEQLAQIAQSEELEILDPRVVGSSLQEKLQKKQMITGLSSNDSQMITGLSSNNSSESLEYDNWSVILHTLTPCSQPGQGTDELNGTNGVENGIDRYVHRDSGHPRSQQDITAFQETTGKFIADFDEHSSKSLYTVSRKSMRALKYKLKE